MDRIKLTTPRIKLDAVGVNRIRPIAADPQNSDYLAQSSRRNAKLKTNLSRLVEAWATFAILASLAR